MRLTLRTLLAYLDNTLDENDSETLRRKIEESGFATELVSRVRSAIADQSLPAVSPDAAGPLEDANAISEYLDSTLTPEQVAEIERACLESGTTLAEAAACHQILTMVLGQPADVPPSLRHRVYELPKRAQPDVGTEFSSVDIPTGDESPPADEAVAAAAAGVSPKRPEQPVKPVGPADSGVSDAPTRIRDSQTGAGAAGDSAPSARGGTIAGSRARTIVSDYYGGSIRPSRITPWLVSLALAAVLLFALGQVFLIPLLEQRTARSPDQPAADTPVGAGGVDSGAEVDGDDTPATDAADEGNADDSSAAPNGGEQADEERPLDNGLASTADPPAEAPTEPSSGVGETAATLGDRENAGEPAAQPTGDSQPAAEEAGAAGPSGEAAAAVTDTTQPGSVSASPGTPGGELTDKPQQESPTPPSVRDPAGRAEPAGELAKMLSDRTLLMARGDGEAEGWGRVEKDELIAGSTTIVCPPLFRAELVTAGGIDVRLVGPARVHLSEASGDDRRVSLAIEFGRVILAAAEPGASINVEFVGKRFRCQLREPETVTAFDVRHIREPGVDPRVEGNRVPYVEVATAMGSAELRPIGETELSVTDGSLTLETNWQWVRRGESASEVSQIDAVPPWIDTPQVSPTSLEQTAREGLLARLDDERSLEMSLRETIQYRRVEVGALAAQALLFMGEPDVYFGSDGVLSEPDQKSYWPDHYRALLLAVDSSKRSARAVDRAIAQMDAADHEKLFQLLVGFSQEDLKDGADAKLVQWLRSPSMAVRVLALENLRRITGTTLYFKPWETNVTRRDNDASKWEVRVRKGGIRWPEAGATGR